MPTIIDSLIVELGLDAKDVDAKAPGVRKKLADIEKSAGAAEGQFKKIKGASKEASSEFTVLTAKLGGFLAVLGGTVAVKAFLKDTVETNTQLFFLSRNLEMATQKIYAWGAATQELGGSKAGIQNFMKTIAGMPGQLLIGQMPQLLPLFARLGINFREPFEQIMMDLSKRFSGMDRKVAFSFGTASGIPEDVMNLLLEGPKAVGESFGRGQKFAPDEKEVESAKELKREFTDLELQFTKIGYDLVEKLTPYLEKFVAVLKSIGDWAQSHENVVAWILGVGSALAGIAALGTALSIAAAAWEALAGSLALIAPIVPVVAALGAAIALLSNDYFAWSHHGASLFDWTEFEKNIVKAKDAFDSLSEKIEKATGSFQKWLKAHGIHINKSEIEKGLDWTWNNMTLLGRMGLKINPMDEMGLNSKSRVSGKDIEEYFTSRGYSKAYALAMAGAAQAESGGNPKAVGDKGTSFGLFQIHDPQRKAAFRKLYGHDISQASVSEQLDFAVLEIKALGIDTSKQVGPFAAADTVVRRFERPLDKAGESARSRAYISSLLSGVPSASAVTSSVSSSSTVNSSHTSNSQVTNIGTINVQQPAGMSTSSPSMLRGMDWTALATQQNYGVR